MSVVNLLQAALDSGMCEKIYLTEILKEFDCDAFFPQFDYSFYLPTTCVSSLIFFFVLTFFHLSEHLVDTNK